MTFASVYEGHTRGVAHAVTNYSTSGTTVKVVIW
jgi:hypothetical protein